MPLARVIKAGSRYAEVRQRSRRVYRIGEQEDKKKC